jgi:UDP-galactopyranose mutase
MTDLVVCLANLRWSCWYDRSQHLMAQCAQERTAIFVEEPEFDSSGPDVEMSETRNGVITLIPHMPIGLTLEAVQRAQRRALDFVLAHLGARNPVLWYYAPQTLGYTDHVQASAIVYDCTRSVDGVGRRHQRLLERANIVFTPETPAAETWPELWRAMWSQVEPLIGREDAERTDVFGSSLLVDSSVLPIPV